MFALAALLFATAPVASPLAAPSPHVEHAGDLRDESWLESCGSACGRCTGGCCDLSCSSFGDLLGGFFSSLCGTPRRERTDSPAPREHDEDEDSGEDDDDGEPVDVVYRPQRF